ncbi:ISAs1 family transposase [Candidatus Enterovibrio escicola]|uniref:ISAs1 family transposase n=1 Tax=Candidatus Enterovibrio escicola TaxID=1927127 RepID=UPI0011BA50BE|nr:ISAs1 family transposase [Candidatus Enterovibrio escacola]
MVAINSKELRECFLACMNTVHRVMNRKVIAIDGKTLRGSFNQNNRHSAIHMVAYFNISQLVYGHVRSNNKSNKITAIPALIKKARLERCFCHP